MRGRLIYPFLVDIARLDTDATAEDPEGVGPPGTGYDDDFNEPVVVPPDGDTSARGAVRRVESVVQLHAQIEDESWEVLNMLSTGRSPIGQVRCVLHFKEIETLGLLDPDGLPLLRVNDRLAAIRNPNTGALIQNVPNPPGLHCTQAQPRSFWRGGYRNLFLMVFEARARGVA